MTAELGKPAHSIIGVACASEPQIVLLSSGQGMPKNVFENLIGKCLREDTSSLSNEESTWVNANLNNGIQMRFASLQTDVAESDVSFFMLHWYIQFSTLITYPKGIKKPNVTSDAGLKVEARLKST